MDKLWYYTQGGSQEKKGPVPEAEIKSLVASEQIQQNDLLWADGMADWMPLSALPQLQSSSPSMAEAPLIPVEAPSHQTPLPEGLTGWMTFMAVMTIMVGAFQCLSCFGIVTGIPTIIAGAALLAAKNALANVSYADSSLSVFFGKLKSFFQLSGIVYIVSFIAVIALFIFYFSVIMAILAGRTGMRP